MEQLNDIEIRVLGALLEKNYTTPEYYPLSLKSLINACNQKSNRNPVVSFDDKTVVRGIEELKSKRYVVQSETSRVLKYAENFVATLNLITQEASLLTVLFLRGPQTLGELRGRTERIWQFEDVQEVEEILGNLVDSGYVVKLPVQPGRKEARYAHLFCGTPTIEDEPRNIPIPPVVAEVQAENDRITSLEKQMSELHNEFNELKDQFWRFKSEFE